MEKVRNKTHLRKLMANRAVYVRFRVGHHVYRVKTTTGEADLMLRTAESNGQEVHAEVQRHGYNANLYLRIFDGSDAGDAWRTRGEVSTDADPDARGEPESIA